MTRSDSSIKVTALAAMLLLVSSITCAQQREPTLRLVLESSKTELVLGEPVYATLTLTNTGSQPVRVQPDLHLESGFAQVQVAPTDGKAFAFIPLAIDDVDAAPRDLAAGASLAAVNQIFFGAQGWTFRSPGNYRITASFRTADRARVTSEPVSLRVIEGEGAGRFLLGTDRATQLEAGKFFVWQQGDHLRRALRVLPELIQKFPNSPVADHARVALAVNLSRSFGDAGAGGTRPPQPQQALQYLDAVNVQNLPPVARLQQQLARARSLGTLGRNTEAQNAINSARELTAGQRALQDLLQQTLASDAEIPRSP